MFSFNALECKASQSPLPVIINKDVLSREDFFRLLQPVRTKELELMAVKANSLTVANFGRTVQIYTPLYLSSYCVNSCIYCGFNVNNRIKRKKLTFEEVRKEAEFIASTGMKHILILTGESRKATPITYLLECVEILKSYFSSISIEIYPLSEEEYKELIRAGVDGLTLYQEVYEPSVYREVHPSGPKSDYDFRLKAPDRALRAGMRTVNIGALLGLYDWQREIVATGLHAQYLQNTYSEAEISVSFPRLRPHAGNYEPLSPVDDYSLTQIIIALRLFLPRLGITLSTRESAELRDNLLPLGVTKMSADSCTSVGRVTSEDVGTEQFSVSDKRSLEEIKSMLAEKGYQPVMKDWMHL